MVKYRVKYHIRKINNVTTYGTAGTFLQKTLKYRLIPKKIYPLLPF